MSVMPGMSPRQAALAQRSFSLRLYRALLRSHRRVLPPVMRALGDEYVRKEFKLHKTAEPQHLQHFYTEWLNYLGEMKKMSETAPVSGGFGTDLDTTRLSAMSDEQYATLQQLRLETAKALNDRIPPQPIDK